MIGSFAHRGLRQLYERGDRSGLRGDMVARIERILHRLDQIDAPEQMALPGYRLHQLTGNLTGFWAITVNANWRIIFRFVDGQVRDVDLVDYH